jgi:TolB-like protein/DNA-binding winged helix-turn-helix (wHTH) protein
MEVLVCLAEHSGEAVPKEKLLQTVWPDTFVSDDVLKRSVSELRRAFGDDAHESRVIETIPKRGYRLVPRVEFLNGSAPAVLPPRHSDPQDSETVTGRRRSWAIAAVSVSCLFLLLGLLLLLKLGGLGDRLLGNRNPSIHSVGVLPLQSLSDDPKQEYFAEGVTDALITDLAQIRALKVVSRTTIMRYGRPDKPLPEIARELNVDGIVEGTVQRSGDRVRITAQLIYGPTDQHLWANSFERDVKDILDLQNAVAREIASQIQVKLTPEEQAKFKNLRPVNPKALDAYVEARFHIDQAGKLEYYKGKQELLKVELRRAVSYLDRATQEDPGYIPAYVAYFDAVDAADSSQLEFLSRAKAALKKALEVDGTNMPAHLALARLLMKYDYDWAGAEKEYKRALELNPNSGDAHFEYSEYLKNADRQTEGNKEFDLAQALNPAHDYLADATTEIERARTLEQQRQALEEQAPNDPFSLAVLGKNYAIAGRFKESIEMYERCLTLYGWQNFASALKRADAKGGPKFALEEWMRAGEEYSRTHDDWSVVAMAFTYASLGNKDRAFAWLDKAIEQRNWMIIYLKRDNVWDPLRSDPRFKDLLRRMGLPQ